MTGDQFACPLCGLPDERIDGIYRHLLTAHHKSSIADALLDSTRPDETETEANDTGRRPRPPAT